MLSEIWSATITFLFWQIFLWASGLGHYVGHETPNSIKAPRWLRICFGDFRKAGLLKKEYLIIQLVALGFTGVFFYLLWASKLTQSMVKTLIILEVMVAGFSTILVLYIVPILIKFGKK